MPILFKHIIFLLAILFMRPLFAQQGFYVPEQGKIFFNSDSATIFTNVINAGKLGVGKTAVVNFMGTRWSNNINALITDESNNGEGVDGKGGLIRFAGDEAQYIIGGYNSAVRYGASFANLEVNNLSGVYLLNSSSKIRNELIFKRGHLFLRNNVLSIGNKSPGKISGYDADKFIVTANRPNDGLLIRENIKRSDGTVIFPIGATVGQYTPAAVKSWSQEGDDYYAGVFDKALRNVINGEAMTDSSVNTTWEIGKRKPTQGINAEIFLQHLNNREGHEFTANRQYAYVSMHDAGSWDLADPRSMPARGSLTTETTLNNSGINIRFIKSPNFTSGYFTKLFRKTDPVTQYPQPERGKLLLWPNPSKGKFKVGLHDAYAIKTIIVWNILGQKMIEESANGRNIIELELRTPGTYVVGFISFSNQLVESKKLLILPKD